MINENSKNKFEDIDVDKVLGIEYEPSDTDVGIMSASFCLIVTDEHEKQRQLYFNEDNFNDLLEVVKPYVKNRELKIENDKEMYEAYKEENKICGCGSPFKTEEEEEIGFCGGCR